jgi:antitoxin ParD1/3/4
MEWHKMLFLAIDRLFHYAVGMNVSLTPRFQRMIDRRVASGRYGSASEVVREALRLLEEREALQQARLRQLRRDVGVGMRALERGDAIPFDSAVRESVKAEGRQRLAQGKRRA